MNKRSYVKQVKLVYIDSDLSGHSYLIILLEWLFIYHFIYKKSTYFSQDLYYLFY